MLQKYQILIKVISAFRLFQRNFNIFIKDKQIQLSKNIMHKSTLVDILFENGQNVNIAKRVMIGQCEDQEIIRKQYENVFKKAHSTSRASKMIKITQFNSSLVIGDEKMFQKGSNLSSSASPQKNFNIKKIGELKNKMAVSAQKVFETQLKKKQKKAHFQLNNSFTQDSSKQPIQKILVTTRCSIKNEVPNIETFTSCINSCEDSHIIERNIDESLSHFFNSNKKGLKITKEAFKNTNKSSKAYSQKNGSTAQIQFMDYSTKLDEFDTFPRKCTGSPRKHYTKHIQQQKKYQQMIEKQKRDMLELKKELNKNYAKPFNPPQNATAYAYIVYEADAKRSKFLHKLSLRRQESPQMLETRKALLNSHKVIVALNSRSSVQIASLTKIMTCILALDLGKKYSIDLSKELVTIGIFEQNIGGTSAKIQKGEIYSIEQLLYGLMLPSGNDASLAIAVWGGKLLLQKQAEKKDILALTACSSNEHSLSSFKKKDCYQRFLLQMNAKAVDLNMQKTKYANSHGLSNFQNKSCAYDLALLCEYAMNKKQFRDIVSCKVYETIINLQTQENSSALKQFDNNNEIYQHQKLQKAQNSNDGNYEGTMQLEQMKDFEQINENYNDDELAEDKNKDGVTTKAIRWQNTHQLLQDKPNLYVGIKTGITNTAGPCLASCLQINGKRYIIIVLNCKSMKYRFKDTENLRKWLFNKEQIKYKDQSKINEKNQGVNQESQFTRGEV